MQKKIFLFLVLFFTIFSHAQVSVSRNEVSRKPTTDQSIRAAKPSASSKTKKFVLNEKNDNDLILEPSENYIALQMINNAMDFLGVNYRGGGTSKAGMDCSGMVTAVFNIFGMNMPRSSNDMSKVGQKIQKEEVRKGDLVFFRTSGKHIINHVGLVIETTPEEIKFIHSSTTKGVIISSTKEPYYQRTFVQANRIL
jgi:murein DD-endopeptidase / murein LD-carboxypeptidase